jgi:peptidoglycan/LPS O-acetylase OafA/YrhL
MTILDSKNFSNPMQLPIIRLFHAGASMVPIFYLVSGYVLSFRQIQHIRNKDWERLHELSVSMVFRRGFRLILPSIAGLIILNMSIYLGMQAEGGPYGKAESTFIQQVGYLFSWSLAGGNGDLHQLWTIPPEFACSMVIFIIILGTSRTPSYFRIGFITAVAFYNLWFPYYWALCLFLVGVVIAEWEAVVKEHEGLISKVFQSRLAYTLYYTFWFTSLVTGLVLCGWPDVDAHRDPIIAGLIPHTPANQLAAGPKFVLWYWTSFGGILIVCALFRLPSCQNFFTTRFALYLGDISYSIYIVHYHLTISMGPVVVKISNAIVGEDRGEVGQTIAIAIELGMLLFVAFWEADLFWRYVDQPCVRFAKWLEETLKVR